MENPDRPAFTENGLTKRELASVLIMAVMVAQRGTRDGADLAKSAVRFADNILAELATQQPQKPVDPDEELIDLAAAGAPVDDQDDGELPY